MLQTTYISSPPSEKITLAEATWQEFRPFLSKYQWAFDDPKSSPRKTEIVSAIRNKRRKGSHTFQRENGWRFVLRPLHAWAFEESIFKHRRIYYVSYGRLALLYFDIDLHCDWQTPEEGREARRLIDALLQRFFGRAVVFWSPSRRGINGYVKVDLQGEKYEAANLLFDRLERALRLFLALYESLADFEVKGKVGFLRETAYDWKHYGKLPFHADWSFDRLEEFKGKPVVNLANLGRLCQVIEARVPPDVLERHNARKKGLGDKPVFEGDWFLVTPAIEQAIVEKHGEAWRYMYECKEDHDGNVWIDARCYRPGEVPLSGLDWRAALAAGRQASTQAPEPNEEITFKKDTPSDEEPAKPRTSPLKVNIKLVDLAGEPDSFKRQKEALFRFARYLKRVPTLEEALDYLHEQNLFTGPWEENQGRRRRRVKDILKFIERTFDAGKCASGTVNVGKYGAWAVKHFPKGLIGRTRSGLDENGDKVDGQAVYVSPAFIAAFMSVVEFALLIDKNQDDSLPHHRGESMWQALNAKGLISVSFCARKWAVCREAMVRHGIVVITDRDYHQGKAMKWAVGLYFPFLGLWKKPKQPSLLGPGCFTRRMRTTQQQHNTLLRKQSPRTGLEDPSMPARPPP
jgi:hypothetical protein